MTTSSEPGSGSPATVESLAGGVTTPAGFQAAGVACGIKSAGLDLALVVSDRPASAAGVFTTNRVQAAPVTNARASLERSGGRATAIIINSGCANACTGDAGVEAAAAMVDRTAETVGCEADDVLIASTGVIGVPLDVARLRAGIDMAAAALGPHHTEAATAIMTTDKAPKEAAVRLTLPGGTVHIGGMAKGAGMIEPMMATMLAVVTTDADVAPTLLHDALVDATRDTFNAISVDGECSTNDTVFALANGASGVRVDAESAPLLVHGLRHVCLALAIAIVRDGEGATKLVKVSVTGATSDEQARRTARAIATRSSSRPPYTEQIRTGVGSSRSPAGAAQPAVATSRGLGLVEMLARGRPQLRLDRRGGEREMALDVGGILGGEAFHPAHPADRILRGMDREIEPREFRMGGVRPGVLDQLGRLTLAAAPDQQPRMAERRGQEIGVQAARALGEVERGLGFARLSGAARTGQQDDHPAPPAVLAGEDAVPDRGLQRGQRLAPAALPDLELEQRGRGPGRLRTDRVGAPRVFERRCLVALVPGRQDQAAQAEERRFPAGPACPRNACARRLRRRSAGPPGR